MQLVGRRRTAFWRGRAPAALLMVFLAGLGLLALAVGSLWPSEKKRLEARARQLVAATAPLALAPMEQALLPQVVLTGPQGDRWLDRAGILAALEAAVARHRITRQRVTIQDVSLRGPQYGLVLVDVATTFGREPWGSRPILTRWLLEFWRPEAQAPWRVSRIQWQRHPSPLALQPARGLWSQ